MSSILFSIVNLVFLVLYYSSLYSAQFPCGSVAPIIKRGRIYRTGRILQGICSILDKFIFTLSPCLSKSLYDWASYGASSEIAIYQCSEYALHIPRFREFKNYFRGVLNSLITGIQARRLRYLGFSDLQKCFLDLFIMLNKSFLLSDYVTVNES